MNVQEVKVLAATTDKKRLPSPEEAIILIAEYLTDSMRKELALPLASLVKQFQPKIPASKITPLQWVGLATSKDRTKPFSLYAYHVNGRTVATDGHRLHSVLDERTPGYILPDGSPIEHDYIYPDVSRVVPRNLDDYIPATCDEVPEGTGKESVYIVCAGELRVLLLTKQYIDAMRGTNGALYIAGSERPIIFGDLAGTFALVMPIREKKA